MQAHLKGEYESKSEMIGIGQNDAEEVRVLGRIISLLHSGVVYEPDKRHAESVVNQFGLVGASTGADEFLL